MEPPCSGTAASAIDVMTEVVTKAQAVTMSVGAPMPTVSRRAGSCRSMRKLSLMPWRRRLGSCMMTCTATPSGLPMARMRKASG